MTGSLFSLADLRERRHSHWLRKRYGDGSYGIAETDETEEVLALCAVVEAADDFLNARNMGARERLQAAVDRFTDV